MQNTSSASPTGVDRLSIGKAAEHINVSIDTLRRWEKKGVITAYRSPGGHRYFLREDLEKLFDQKYTRTSPTKKGLPSTAEPQIAESFPQIQSLQPEDQDTTESTMAVQKLNQPIKEPSPQPADTQNLPSQTDQAGATDEKKVIEEKAEQFVKDLGGPTTQKSFPIKKAINIGFIIFVVIDVILFLIYLTLDRIPLSPIL